MARIPIAVQLYSVREECAQDLPGTLKAVAEMGYEGVDFAGYHELPWDIFFGATSSEVVMQLDAGNALLGGGDPVDFLERYPGRALTVHLKEYAADNDKALIGEGDVRWEDVFRLCESTGGTEWYIVEQESYAFSPLECIERCLRNLQEMGK